MVNRFNEKVTFYDEENVFDNQCTWVLECDSSFLGSTDFLGTTIAEGTSSTGRKYKIIKGRRYLTIQLEPTADSLFNELRSIRSKRSAHPLLKDDLIQKLKKSEVDTPKVNARKGPVKHGQWW